MTIILSPCAKNIIKAECKQDMIECLDRLEKTNNEYKKCLTSLYDTGILLNKYMHYKERNILFPYVGFRYTNNLIIPQLGIGYIRKIKTVKKFSVGAGGLFDVAFNSTSIYSIGIAANIVFMF